MAGSCGCPYKTLPNTATSNNGQPGHRRLSSCLFSILFSLAASFLSLYIWVSKKCLLSPASLFKPCQGQEKGIWSVWGSEAHFPGFPRSEEKSISTVSLGRSRVSEPFNVLNPAQAFNSYPQPVGGKKRKGRQMN